MSEPRSESWVRGGDIGLLVQAQTECVEIRLAKAWPNNGIAQEFKRMLAWLCDRKGGIITGLGVADVQAYRSSLTASTEIYLGRIVSALKVAVEQGHAWIDQLVWKLVDGFRLKGGPKGVAVATRCPDEGPLTRYEQEALDAAVVAAYESGGTRHQNILHGTIP